jgi:hypothetical protein
VLIPLAALISFGVVIGWRSVWSRELRKNPVFVTSLLAVGGYILFMTFQNHPQPRYFTVVAFFSFFVVVVGVQAFLSVMPAIAPRLRATAQMVPVAPPAMPVIRNSKGALLLGYGALGAAFIAAGVNAEWTVSFAMHPEYTLVPAAQKLTRYIDAHPNGKRLLLSISGDEITMITDLPTICDDFGTQDLVSKLKDYQPGWFATWNDLDPGTLEDLHNHYSLEQVASFHAFDHPDRNVLVLFKLHPLAKGQVRDPAIQNLQDVLPGDRIDIPIE